MKQNQKPINKKPLATKPQVKQKGLISKKPDWYNYIALAVLLLIT